MLNWDKRQVAGTQFTADWGMMPQLQQIWHAFKKGKKKKNQYWCFYQSITSLVHRVSRVELHFFRGNAGEKETKQTRENFNKCFTPLILLTSLWEKLQPWLVSGRASFHCFRMELMHPLIMLQLLVAILFLWNASFLFLFFQYAGVKSISGHVASVSGAYYPGELDFKADCELHLMLRFTLKTLHLLEREHGVTAHLQPANPICRLAGDKHRGPRFL